MHIEPQKTQPSRRAIANQIDVICDQFERSLRAGERPKIEQYLRRGSDVEQSRLLEELLALEAEFLCQEDGDVDTAKYVARFPKSEAVVREVFMRANENLTLTFLPLLLTHAERFGRQPAPETLVELQHLASERRFAVDEPLVRQGEEATSLMVIREGVAEIRLEDEDGTTHVIGSVGPGQLLGEMALLTSEPRTASAIAVKPVLAAVLPVASFHDLSRRHPQLSSVLTELVAERLGNSQHDALTDKRLDRYRIRHRLGRGGMSIVYQALDTVNNSLVALKMMSHRFVFSTAGSLRFQTEADMIERLDHPHVVRMYRRFAAFRTYFIAMEYCAGETLAEYLQRNGPLDESSFRISLGQLAAALRHAHDAGIVHRDIKPSNIMRLDDGTLKLMDFGLAEPIVPESTGKGEIVGTPRYMAPEQRLGNAVDQRADYFSLGCVAYEALTGRALFPRAVLQELNRDFRDWHPPKFDHLEITLNQDTTRMLQPMLAVDPRDRIVDLSRIAHWCE